LHVSDLRGSSVDMHPAAALMEMDRP